MTHSAEEVARKQRWRRALLADRAAATEQQHTADARALSTAVSRYVTGNGFATVCGYVPVGGEPGSPGLLDALRDAGCRVLLPVVTGARPLEWADYTGPDSLRPARYGLLEPAGDRLGPQAIGDADLVLVPALAVDGSGRRLGRGGGHYDRSLPLASPAARLLVVVRDAELVRALPAEEHDVPMHAVLTPGNGVLELPLRTAVPPPAPSGG